MCVGSLIIKFSPLSAVKKYPRVLICFKQKNFYEEFKRNDKLIRFERSCIFYVLKGALAKNEIPYGEK